MEGGKDIEAWQLTRQLTRKVCKLLLKNGIELPILLVFFYTYAVLVFLTYVNYLKSNEILVGVRPESMA